MSYPVGIVPPRTKSPVPESSSIASYVTLRKSKKPDPRTVSPWNLLITFQLIGVHFKYKPHCELRPDSVSPNSSSTTEISYDSPSLRPHGLLSGLCKLKLLHLPESSLHSFIIACFVCGAVWHVAAESSRRWARGVTQALKTSLS